MATNKGIGYGDKLARGGISAKFPASDGGVSADKWAAAFDDFDPEAYKAEKKTEETE